MKILDALLEEGPGGVLADEGHGVVRLWTLAAPFRDGRVWVALVRVFPHAERYGAHLIRLGGWSSLQEAQSDMADKVFSYSPAVSGLYRFDVPESLATLKHVVKEN